jgi:hypothetical protein
MSAAIFMNVKHSHCNKTKSRSLSVDNDRLGYDNLQLFYRGSKSVSSIPVINRSQNFTMY